MMISGTFYRKNSAAKVAQHERAANDDVNRAADFLQRILTLDTPARDPVTHVASPLSLRMIDQIESCISRLQALKQRLQRHAYLRDLIQQAERDLKNSPCIFSERSADIEQQIIDVQSQLSNLLEEKELLMRTLLVARKQLQDCETDSSSGDDPVPHDVSKSSSTVCSSRASHVTSASMPEIKVNTFPTSSPLTMRDRNNSETPVWDDSLDDD